MKNFVRINNSIINLDHVVAINYEGGYIYVMAQGKDKVASIIEVDSIEVLDRLQTLLDIKDV